MRKLLRPPEGTSAGEFGIRDETIPDLLSMDSPDLKSLKTSLERWLKSDSKWPLLAGFAVGVFVGVLLRD